MREFQFFTSILTKVFNYLLKESQCTCGKTIFCISNFVLFFLMFLITYFSTDFMYPFTETQTNIDIVYKFLTFKGSNISTTDTSNRRRFSPSHDFAIHSSRCWWLSNVTINYLQSILKTNTNTESIINILIEIEWTNLTSKQAHN